MISKEDRRAVEIAGKYKLRLGTMKFQIFCLFEEGYKPREVRYILRDYIVVADDPVIRSIYRYHSAWKKMQDA